MQAWATTFSAAIFVRTCCPWNSRAPITEDPDFAGTAVPIAELAKLTPEEFRQRFKDSPIARATYSGLMRNVIFAMGIARGQNH